MRFEKLYSVCPWKVVSLARILPCLVCNKPGTRFLNPKAENLSEFDELLLIGYHVVIFGHFLNLFFYYFEFLEVLRNFEIRCKLAEIN